MTWEWKLEPDRGGAQIRFINNGKSVVIYDLGTSLKTSYKLEDIIAGYGEPSHVLAEAYYPTTIVRSISMWLNLPILAS
jgi:hypothetical protein